MGSVGGWGQISASFMHLFFLSHICPESFPDRRADLGVTSCALLPPPCGVLGDRLTLEGRSSLVSGVWSFRTTVPSTTEYRGRLRHS